jgi:hypothetical protein
VQLVDSFKSPHEPLRFICVATVFCQQIQNMALSGHVIFVFSDSLLDFAQEVH